MSKGESNHPLTTSEKAWAIVDCFECQKSMTQSFVTDEQTKAFLSMADDDFMSILVDKALDAKQSMVEWANVNLKREESRQ